MWAVAGPLLLFGAALLAAEPKELHFGCKTKAEEIRISFEINGSKVTGQQLWRPTGEHTASGSFEGVLTQEGEIRGVYEFTIEASEQMEEQVFKMKGDELLIGSGARKEGEDGVLRFLNPKAVTFEKALPRIPLHKPAKSDPEYKAIVKAMVPALSKEAKMPVGFSGDARVVGNWASFNGHVLPPNGESDDDPLFFLDYFALLKRDKRGVWKPLIWGTSGDPGSVESAREEYPEAPWAIFPYYPIPGWDGKE
jgi:hypothetical protein